MGYRLLTTIIDKHDCHHANDNVRHVNNFLIFHKKKFAKINEKKEQKKNRTR